MTLNQVKLMPEGGEGGGTNDPPANPPAPENPPEDKRFTQAELEDHIQKRLKTIKRDAAAKDEAIKKMQEQLTQLQSQLDKKKEEETPPSDVQGQLVLMQQKYERQIEGLNSKIDELTKQLTDQTQKRKFGERDRELDAALIKAGCNNMKLGRNGLIPQITYDEVDGKWIYNLESGGTVSIEEGVEAELPDSLRRPKAERGGAGSSSNGRRGQKTSELEAEKQKLAKLYETGKATGKPQDVHSYNLQKRKVLELERQLAETKG
jgi:uncharacterized phage infection (PIP) family protein YhgE